MATCACGTEVPGRRRKCDACKAGVAVEPEAPKSAVDQLQSRGRTLWSALGLDLDTAAGQLALEACRTADRLDELDSVIAGKGVLSLMQFRLGQPWWDDDREEHVHVTVGFQSVLAEARQQSIALKNLLVELGLTAASAVPAGPTPALTPLDELEQRRQQQQGK